MANFRFKSGDFKKALSSDLDKMAIAATAAMAETANAAKTAGRASIAQAGFSAKWQNALRANLYPSSGNSLSPAALIFDRIGYSEIFQTGGDIAGHPLLWLPIEANLPGSATKWTPARYAQSVGPLLSVNLPGRRPMLFAAKKRGPPLFVGVDQVTLRKRFNVDEAVASEAAKLPARYAAKLKE
ncbi:hypothetical protein FFI89_018755 [Bradyrhizobium sp. KBS0727]|uniref:DUF6441 family protein n=1 Tax=unclassified Bradyrhizobium TaxID=2631580 RepID=UPI00110F2D9E|nr:MULTISPECIES: DUF6441 family protein [unclassified Bradyrhizobium]QDW39006.1 hypothetical protein FFI71_018755 [Bradyrhizobium sp. KBS0725]QDW45609.1 hypothetical protein FFI89_018755 [Bradyrhizobium sp. KBS0727]